MHDVWKKLHGKGNIAIVLAGSFGALAVIRELGKHGVSVVAVGEPDYIRKSKYCLDLNIKKPEEIMRFLKELPRHVQEKPVLLTDNEEHLQLLYDNWHSLSRFYLAPFDVTNRLLTDKCQLYEHALKAGINAPVTYTGDAQLNVKTFPVIVKPINDDKLWADSGLKYQKVYECQNRNELIETLNMLKRYEADSVTQEIIPGDVTNLCCVTLYRNHLGTIMTGCVVKKMRQYPMNYGTGTVHLTCDQEKLIAYSKRLLEATNYIGVAMIEYKYDARSQTFFIIEVNGRFPVETGIVKKLGNDFVYRVYKDVVNPSRESRSYQSPDKPVVWIYVLNHLRTIMQKGSNRLKDLLGIIGKYRVQFALWDWADPVPCLYFPKYVYKRIFHRGKAVNG